MNCKFDDELWFEIIYLVMCDDVAKHNGPMYPTENAKANLTRMEYIFTNGQNDDARFNIICGTNRNWSQRHTLQTTNGNNGLSLVDFFVDGWKIFETLWGSTMTTHLECGRYQLYFSACLNFGFNI